MIEIKNEGEQCRGGFAGVIKGWVGGRANPPVSVLQSEINGVDLLLRLLC